MPYRTSIPDLAITRVHVGSMPTRVRMGQFTFDVKAGELHEGACRTVLQNQPLQVLLMLVEHPGEVVSRHEIQQQLWPDGIIVNFEVGISQVVSKLRRALHDSASQPRYVETVGRRGYRLKVPVTTDISTPAEFNYVEPMQEYVSGPPFDNSLRVMGMDERKVLAEVLRQLLQMLAYVGKSLQQVPATEARPSSLGSLWETEKAPSRSLSIPGSSYRTG